MEKFYQLVEEEWEERMKQQPLLATRVGDHRYNDRLPRIGEEYYENKRINAAKYLDDLNQINSSNFEARDRLNYDIFKIMLRNRISMLNYKFYRMAISKVNGFHLTLSQIYKLAPFSTYTDYGNYISRIHQIPKFIEGHMEIMVNGLKEGQIAPKVTMIGVAQSIRNQVKESGDLSPYFEPFEAIPKHFDDGQIESLQKQGKHAIGSSLFPAFLKFADFLEKEYLPNTREDIAAINLPSGLKYYETCIKYHTTLNLNADEVHKIGLNEVEKIRNEMSEVIKEASFTGSIQEFIDFLRTSPQFYVDTPEQLLEKVARILKKIDGSLPKLFKTLPRLPYGIESIPDYAAPGNYTGYYNYGTGDGTRSGTYYVNTYDLKSRGLFEYDALSLHEAVPGHHLQLALQQENEVPNFRKYENFNAFIEGWALYSERLGFDCGLYITPYTNFGRLSFEMWRACRLVVDTGMHVFGWSRQQAIDYMSKNTSLSLLNIENEVDRYISWPGQALAYKLGELKIRELRQFAENELRETFDIREFHDAILSNGSLPLEILEEHIQYWINQINSKNLED